MPKYTEKEIQDMLSKASKTTNEMAENAISMVEKALDGYEFKGNQSHSIRINESFAYGGILESKRDSDINIEIFVQGSYANDTNIDEESDVDVAIILKDNRLPFGDEYSIKQALYDIDIQEKHKVFKNEIYKLLMIKDPSAKIKNKSICINGNTYRAKIDVVPALDYIAAWNQAVNGAIYILSDDGEEIINYPKQHIENGAIKNKKTSYRFKKFVRLAKRIKEDMKNDNIVIPECASSFRIESAFWNVPNYVYGNRTDLLEDFSVVLNHLGSNMTDYKQFKEVNAIKRLFNNEQESDLFKQFIRNMSDYFNKNRA